MGDVLVERTVGEVLPAVQCNKAQLDEVSVGVGREVVGGGRGAACRPSIDVSSSPPFPPQVLAKLKADAAAKEKELQAMIKKYKIRPVRAGEASGAGASGSGGDGSNAPPAGVLV